MAGDRRPFGFVRCSRRPLKKAASRAARIYGLDEMSGLIESQIDSVRNIVREYSPEDWDAKINEYICRYI